MSETGGDRSADAESATAEDEEAEESGRFDRVLDVVLELLDLF